MEAAPEFLVAVFAFGALLLLAGIVGGDLTFQGARLPKVGRLPRFALTTLGAVFIVASGVIWLTADPSTSSGEATPPPAPSVREATPNRGDGSETGSVRFTISRELAPFHISEEITLVLDQRRVGTLRLDAQRRIDSVAVSVPRPGTFGYDVLLVARTPTNDRSTFVGAGTIDPMEGGDVRVTLNRSSAGAELVTD